MTALLTLHSKGKRRAMFGVDDGFSRRWGSSFPLLCRDSAVKKMIWSISASVVATEAPGGGSLAGTRDGGNRIGVACFLTDGRESAQKKADPMGRP